MFKLSFQTRNDTHASIAFVVELVHPFDGPCFREINRRGWHSDSRAELPKDDGAACDDGSKRRLSYRLSLWSPASDQQSEQMPVMWREWPMS